MYIYKFSNQSIHVSCCLMPEIAKELHRWDDRGNIASTDLSLVDFEEVLDVLKNMS